MPTTRSAYNALLPNKGSKLQTAASLRFDLHYAKLNVVRRWDWQRYRRLAQFLNLTVGELASLVGMPHRDLTRLQSWQRVHGSAALLLTLLEAQCCRNYTHDVIENPFPNGPLQAHQEIRSDD